MTLTKLDPHPWPEYGRNIDQEIGALTRAVSSRYEDTIGSHHLGNGESYLAVLQFTPGEHKIFGRQIDGLSYKGLKIVPSTNPKEPSTFWLRALFLEYNDVQQKNGESDLINEAKVEIRVAEREDLDEKLFGESGCVAGSQVSGDLSSFPANIRFEVALFPNLLDLYSKYMGDEGRRGCFDFLHKHAKKIIDSCPKET